MRHFLIIALFVSSPAAACGFDGMLGFNHYSDAGADVGAAEAMREAAIAEARANFMTRYGIVETADNSAVVASPTDSSAGSTEPAPQ
jgi:hypothetical protein